MPTIQSRYGSDWTRVAIPYSAEWSLRMHMISCTRSPNRRQASSRARRSPPITVPNATPLLVCACGSKKISA